VQQTSEVIVQATGTDMPYHTPLF